MRLYLNHGPRTHTSVNKCSRVYKKLVVLLVGASICQFSLAASTDQESALPAQYQEQQVTPQQRIAALSYKAQDIKQPQVQRIQALRELANYPSQNALVAVVRSLQDSEPEVREANCGSGAVQH